MQIALARGSGGSSERVSTRASGLLSRNSNLQEDSREYSRVRSIVNIIPVYKFDRADGESRKVLPCHRRRLTLSFLVVEYVVEESSPDNRVHRGSLRLI